MVLWTYMEVQKFTFTKNHTFYENFTIWKFGAIRYVVSLEYFTKDHVAMHIDNIVLNLNYSYEQASTRFLDPISVAKINTQSLQTLLLHYEYLYVMINQSCKFQFI